jgi:hypothetical protein
MLQYLTSSLQITLCALRSATKIDTSEFRKQTTSASCMIIMTNAHEGGSLRMTKMHNVQGQHASKLPVHATRRRAV